MLSCFALHIPSALLFIFFLVVSAPNGPSSTLSKNPEPEGNISGRVWASEQTPMAGATVAALLPEYYGEQKRFSLVETARTRADGTYSLDGLRPGKYLVVAVASDQPTDGPPRTFQPTYYPFSNSPADAIAVAVTPGTETGAIDLTMSDAPSYSVCGKVEGLPDMLPESASLMLIRLGPESIVFPPRKADFGDKRGSANHFCFQSVPAGDYSVELRGSLLLSEGKVAVTGSAAVAVSNQSLTGLRLLAGYAARMEGNVRVEDPLIHPDVYAGLAAPVPIYDQHQQLVSLEPNPNAALLPVRSQPLNPSRAATVPGMQGDVDMRILLDSVESFEKNLPPLHAQVQNGGHFALKAVPSGRYRVLAEDLPLGFFVKTVRYGGRDLTSDDLEIVSGSTGQLDIVLSGDAVFIRGTVSDGSGNTAAGALVSLLPASDRQIFSEGQVARTTTAGPDGQFAFWNLAPGTYLLWAWQQLESPGLATSPSFLRAYAPRALRIEAVNPADPSYVVKLDFVPRAEVLRAGWPY